MPRRVFSPKSRQFNERQITRVQSRYDGGMSRDLDELGSRNLAELINGRAVREDVVGRPGCELVTPADWGVTITDDTETLAVAIQSGEMYAASGRDKTANTVPEADSKFMVYGDGDTTGDDLATAKGEAPRKYDVFQIDNSGSGTEATSYLGSIRLPALEGYGDTVANELTASKSGTTITVTSGTLTTAHENQYWDWGDGTDLIKSVTSTTTCEVENSGTRASTGKCRIMGRVNASWFHQSEKKLVLMIGQKLYVANALPWYSWTEIEREGSYYELEDSFCKMYEDDDDIILINGSGFYRIKIDGSTDYRYWRINDRSPEADNRPADVPRDKTGYNPKKYPYRYILKFARIKNLDDNAQADRYDTNSILEWESGAAKADENGKDYFEITTTKPAGKESRYTTSPTSDRYSGLLVASRSVGGYLGTTETGFNTVEKWNEILDGAVHIDVTIFDTNDSSTDVEIDTPETDFSAATDLEGVAEILENSMNKALIEYGIKISVTLERDDTGENFVFDTTPGVYLNSINGAPSIGTSLVTYAELSTAFGRNHFVGVSISGINPEDDVRTATHYALYRTKVLDDDGIDAGNNPNLFVHVADIPMIHPVLAVFYEGAEVTLFNTTAGTLDWNDLDSTYVLEDGTSGYIVYIDIDGEDGAHAGSESATIGASSALAIGASNAFIAAVSGSTMTIVRGEISLSEEDVGKPVWFASGELRWIKSVTSVYVAELTKSGDIAETACGMNPTTRVFTDDVFDEINVTYTDAITPRVKNYTLPSRFTVELPNCNIGKVVPGWLFGAVQGKNVYYYSDTAKNYLAGAYAPDLQYNDKIDGAIQEFLHQGDYLGIRTEFGTWRLNLATVNDLGNPEVGENIDGFNDPEISDNSVGSEGEGGTAILENGNFLTFTSEPSIREFNMFEYGENLAHERIQESDIQELEPHTIMLYDHILGLVLWGEK